MPLQQHAIAVGCEKCFYSGYKGRQAIYEVINVDAELSNLIKMKQLDVIDTLRKKNFRSLADNAFSLLQTGQTSIDEVYAILSVH